jgi:hypothetical protein
MIEINQETEKLIIAMIDDLGNIKTRELLEKVYPSLYCIVSDYDQFVQDEVNDGLDGLGIIYTSPDSRYQAEALMELTVSETYTTEYIGDWVLVFYN